MPESLVNVVLVVLLPAAWLAVSWKLPGPFVASLMLPSTVTLALTRRALPLAS
jgi:hypothetical protein